MPQAAVNLAGMDALSQQHRAECVELGKQPVGQWQEPGCGRGPGTGDGLDLGFSGGAGHFKLCSDHLLISPLQGPRDDKVRVGTRIF